jgi:ribonuclease HI
MKPPNPSRPFADGRMIIYTDGASRGNPGRAGVGVRITNETGETVAETARYLGHKTNNEAEYWGLLLGLREAKRLGAKTIRICMDSELVERQVRGIYRVRNEKLKPLHERVMAMLKEFRGYEIRSIPREENAEADRLANEAIEKHVEMERAGT